MIGMFLASSFNFQFLVSYVFRPNSTRSNLNYVAKHACERRAHNAGGGLDVSTVGRG